MLLGEKLKNKSRAVVQKNDNGILRNRIKPAGLDGKQLGIRNLTGVQQAL